ncbi:hypothetical protein LEP1GSC005_2326 [Leptospira santarosai str. ST188]|nr:hypothetical protein LEP1GSC005_2326 [Leptospira santarosai str. ST188]EMM78230.1 hypothetical protein LEP1GSC040_2095 [Leptospira santarosai str. 2000030832]EMO99420.1 hypothetical protein LEP1GSC120_2452 [Leptospira santarosai str. 200702252]
MLTDKKKGDKGNLLLQRSVEIRSTNSYNSLESEALGPFFGLKIRLFVLYKTFILFYAEISRFWRMVGQ